MRKRFICLLLLGALMIFLTGPRTLAEDYPLEVKFLRQIQESAYKASVTAEVTGEGTGLIEPEAWETLKALAGTATLNLDHSVQRGETQTALELIVKDESAGRTVLLSNGQKTAFASVLLSGEDVFYTLTKEGGPETLLPEESRGLARALGLVWALETASEETKKALEEQTKGLKTDLEIWVSAYADYTTGTDENGVDYTELSCVLPGPAVKAEIKKVLTKVYANAELLSILRQAAGDGPAAAWLTPQALGAALDAAEGLAVRGEIRILRRYDALGRPLLDQVSFPDPANEEGRLTLTAAPAAGVQTWTVAREGGDGAWTVTVAQTGETAYAGTVETESAAFAYAIEWHMGEENYSLSTDKFEKTVSGKLTVSPLKENAFPAWTLSGEGKFSSGSSRQSATRLDGDLVWRDEESGAKIVFHLTSKTAAPFEIRRIGELESPRALEDMDGEALGALIKEWTESAGGWIGNILLRTAEND